MPTRLPAKETVSWGQAPVWYHSPLEAVQTVEGRAVGDREAPGRHDAIGGGEARAVVGGDPPASCCLVEGRLGDGLPEPDVPAEIEPVRHMLQVAQDLRLGGEALAPPPLLLQCVGELVRILDTIEVAAGAGIAVPVPGAADSRCPASKTRTESPIERSR